MFLVRKRNMLHNRSHQLTEQESVVSTYDIRLRLEQGTACLSNIEQFLDDLETLDTPEARAAYELYMDLHAAIDKAAASASKKHEAEMRADSPETDL